MLPQRPRERHADVRIDVHLPHPIPDPHLHLFQRHAEGLRNLPSELVDQVLKVAWNRRGAVHDQMRGREALVDLSKGIHGERVAGGSLAEFVGAMRRPDRHRQGVDVSFAHEGSRLVRVGDEFALVEGTLETVTVFLVAAAGLERTEATDLSLDRDADRVGRIHNRAR